MAGGGKPGTSGRCDECRRRRKKCDLQEPHCLRCRTAGIRCSGPNRAPVFVHRQASSFESETQRAVLIHAYQSRSVAAGHSRDFYHVTSSYIQRLRNMLLENQWKSSLVNDSAILLGPDLANELYYSALLEEFKPGRSSHGIFSGDRITVGSWRHYSSVAICIRALLPLASLRNRVLDRSIFTLLALYYGRLHGDSRLVDLSKASYTVALGQYYRYLHLFLAKDDRSVQQYQSFMCASTALQLFEHLSEIDVFGEGHLAHVDGALKLLHSSGPLSMRDSPVIRQAFSGLRGIAIFVDLHRRIPSFLSEPEWLGLPSQDQERTIRDRLLDLSFEVSPLLNFADKLQANLRAGLLDSSQFCNSAIALLTTFESLRKKFDVWLSSLRTIIPGPLYWPRSHPVVQSIVLRDAECEPRHINSFQQLLFPCGAVAGILVHFWSYQLELLMTMIDLQNSVLDTTNSLSAPKYAIEARSSFLKSQATAGEMAQLILEAEPYLSSCFEGFICLQSPLKIATRYFQREDMSEGLR